MAQKRKKGIDRKIVNAIKKGEYWFPSEMDIWSTPEGKVARREMTKEGTFWEYKRSSKSKLKTKTMKKSKKKAVKKTAKKAAKKSVKHQKKAKKLNSHYTKVHKSEKAADSHARRIRSRKGKVKKQKTDGKYRLTYSF